MKYGVGFWLQVTAQTYTVNLVDIPKKIYNPIPDLEFVLGSSSILIGINCPKAYKEWRLAAYCSIQAKINTSSLFGQWVDLKTETLLIQRLTLLEAPILGNTELKIRLKIPHWHEEIYLEIWEYTGTSSPSIDERLQNIELDLERIESKIDNTSEYNQ